MNLNETGNQYTSNDFKIPLSEFLLDERFIYVSDKVFEYCDITSLQRARNTCKDWNDRIVRFLDGRGT